MGYVESPSASVELTGKVTGTVRVVVIGRDCLYLDALSDSGSDESVGVTVRGARYLASAHAYRRADGVWGIGRDFAPTDRHSADLHVTRPWEHVRGRYAQPTTSAAAFRDVLAALEQLAADYADENPDALTAGAIAAEARELYRLEQKREHAAAELADIDAEIAQLERYGAPAEWETGTKDRSDAAIVDEIGGF